MSQYSRAQGEVGDTAQWWNIHSPGRNRRGLQVHSWTACARPHHYGGGMEHVRQSENRKRGPAIRFTLFAQGYDGIRLSLSVCITPKRCLLLHLRAWVTERWNNNSHSTREKGSAVYSSLYSHWCRVIDLLYIYESRRMECSQIKHNVRGVAAHAFQCPSLCSANFNAARWDGKQDVRAITSCQPESPTTSMPLGPANIKMSLVMTSHAHTDTHTQM